MFIYRRSRNVRLAAVALASALGVARLGAADEPPEATKEACARSYEEAQTLRLAKELTRARRELARCQETCPEALAEDCRRWSDEIQRELSTVVIVTIDHAGRPLSNVELRVDGEL